MLKFVFFSGRYSERVYCYSCSASFSSSSTPSITSINCLQNTTNLRPTLCSSGYYCLLSYRMQEGNYFVLRINIVIPFTQNKNCLLLSLRCFSIRLELDVFKLILNELSNKYRIQPVNALSARTQIPFYKIRY